MSKFKGDLILILAAFVYGSGLVAQSEGNALGPWTYSSLRFLLGAIVLIPVVLITQKRKPEEVKKKELTFKQILPGCFIVALDLVLMVITQQNGLIYTTVGKAGFITSLYVVGVPLVGVLIFRRRIPKHVLLAAVIAVIGFYFVSLTEGIGDINRGDLLMLISSLTCVVFVYLMEYFAPKADASMFTMMQFAFTGLMCLPGALIFEDTTISMIADNLGAVLYGGIGICAMGYTLQMIGQKFVPPERASIILSLESIFSLLSGMVILNEMLSIREYIGCALIFVAVILSEIRGKNDER